MSPRTLAQPSPLRILNTRLNADPTRVVLRPFHLGWQADNRPSDRAIRLCEDILSLSEDEAELEYQRVVHDFAERHWQTELVFDRRYSEVETALGLDGTRFSQSRRRLVGAFFCHEYTYAAAALMNPSIVAHPDQSGVEAGACRFIMSVRAVGEGHISSIAFREGIAMADGSFSLWPQGYFATSVETAEGSMVHDDRAVTVIRNPESNLSNTVIFPITEAQRNGLEDLRLVRFQHEDGSHEWIGTYTAYSGRAIRSEMLRTRDFREFQLEPIKGRAGRGKGMALFPEKIDGQYIMVSRQDGKNLFLLRSDEMNRWDVEGEFLMGPAFPWEFIQIGNCGSPILTDAGWLLFTHGVGAMRKYALGCALLDTKEPSRVLARSREPLLMAEDADRSGYVPNVVYTCGALCIGSQLLIPYGISDSAIGFATVSLDDLLATMT